MKLPAKYWIPGATITFFIAIEIALRLAFGLGNPVLTQPDPDIGYRFQPNQKVLRFGKTIQYNQYSQRSEPITPQKPPGTLRILMVGDSVLNGGNPTDGSQTITELFEAKLVTAGHPAEVLNASAGSWSIGNQLAYLRKFGIFASDVVILQIGTHDLIQPTSTSAGIENNPNFPTRRPLLAIQDAWTRYLWPNLAPKFRLSAYLAEPPPPSSINPQQQFQQNMQQFKAMVTLIRARQTPVFVLFTPNLDDLVPPRVPQYKTEFFQLLKTLKVPALDSHTAWSKQPPTTVETYFRDYVHLSVPGNKAIAALLFERLCAKPQLKACSPGG